MNGPRRGIGDDEGNRGGEKSDEGGRGEENVEGYAGHGGLKHILNRSWTMKCPVILCVELAACFRRLDGHSLSL